MSVANQQGGNESRLVLKEEADDFRGELVLFQIDFQLQSVGAVKSDLKSREQSREKQGDHHQDPIVHHHSSSTSKVA